MGSKGLRTVPVFSLNRAIRRVLELLYHGMPRPNQPVLAEYLSKQERNEHIRARYASGESIADLARDYQISDQRVFQLIHYQRK